jgi:hypothetical protein
MSYGVQSAIVQRIIDHALAGDVDIDYYSPTQFGVAVPTTGATDSFVIDGDAAFVVYQLNGSVFQPAGTNIASPDLLVDIKNQGSGRYFSFKPMHWVTMIGTGQNPFQLPEPKILAPTSNVTTTLTNNSGGSFARADLTWVGVKLFMRGNFTLADLSLPIDFAYAR